MRIEASSSGEQDAGFATKALTSKREQLQLALSLQDEARK